MWPKEITIRTTEKSIQQAVLRFQVKKRIVPSYEIANYPSVGYAGVGIIYSTEVGGLVEQAAKLTLDNGEALHKIRSHWLARVIHDFRGPLFAARGYTKLILDDRAGDVTVTQRRYLETVIENINKLSILANSFQEFPSDSTLHLEPLDIGDLLGLVVTEYRTRAKTLHFSEDIPPAPVVTVADRAKLTVAMHKLLGATVEFSRSDGEVQVHARLEDDEFSIKIVATRDGKTASSDSPALSDITMACDILRLHGGVAHADAGQDGRYRVTIRLPLVSVGS